MPIAFAALLLLSGLSVVPAAPAPAAGSLQGTVRAEGSLEAIPHATVQIRELGRATLTDEAGYFVLPEVRPGRWVLLASAPGYGTVEQSIEVPATGTRAVELVLPTQPVLLEGVEVRAPGGAGASAGAGPGAARIDPRVVHAVPALAEVDVLRAVQLLPSVQAASDFSSAPYVRGGSPDQNLIVLDGVPLFNPYHLGGVFGAIDPDAVASVDVLPGAFPARVGDRLSSAIEIRTRDGGRDRVRASGAVGVLSSRAAVDGPLPSGRGSFLLSLRRTYVDLFADALHAANLIPQTFPYGFTDAHLKLTHDVGTFGRISASLYLDEEGFNVPTPQDFGGDANFAWGSRAASLVYRQPLGPALVGEFRLGASGFGGRFRGRDEFCARDPFNPELCFSTSGPDRPDSLRTTVAARTRVSDLLAAADFTWHRRRHQLRGGLQLDSYLFDHDIFADAQSFEGYIPSLRQRDEPRTLAAYAEDEWQVTDAMDVRAGLRVLAAGERGTAWMPRLGARYQLTPTVTLSVGGGRYAQVMHSLRNEEAVAASLMAYDLFAGVPVAAGLSSASDVAAGLAWEVPNTSVRVDGYLKRFHKLPLPPLPDNAFEAPVLAADSLLTGSGTASGLELLARHRRGQAEFTLSYALSFAEFEAAGERYPPRFGRRHVLDLLAALPLGERGSFSARFAAATGQPYSPVDGVIPQSAFDPATGIFRPDRFGDSYAFVFGEHNSALLPSYLRLDIGARKRYEKRWFGRGITLTPYLQVLNVLNSANVLAALPESSGFGEPAFEFAPQLPILPTFGVEWSF